MSLLRDHDFRQFWIAETTSKVGSSASTVAMPLVATTTLDATAFQVSLLVAATWLPWLVVGLPAGAWVDRLPRRPVLVVCDLVSAVVLASAPVAAWLGLLTIGQLLLVALLAGVVAVFQATAFQVYLPALVRADDLPEGNAKLQGSESAAQVAGPGLGGLLAQLGGAVTALLADAVTFAVSAVCLLRIRRAEPPVPDRAPEPIRAAIAVGLRVVGRDPYLRVLMVAGAASNLALTAYQAVLVVFLVREVGVGPGAVGLLVSLGAVGGIVGALLAGPLARRFGSARMVLTLELGAGPFALLLPLTSAGAGQAFVVVSILGVAACVVAGNVLVGAFRQQYCPPELLGRVTATMRVLNYGTMPLAAVLGGALATGIGLRPTMWVGTAGVLLAALILLVGPLKSHRDLPVRVSESAPG